MIPEQKCVSLETAKRLKAAGFSQDTEHFWYQYVMERTPEAPYQKGDWELRPSEQWGNGTGEHIAAPDAQDIGELLPRNFGSELFMQLRPSGWLLRVDGYEALNDNEAEARASVWLWLKERELI